MMKKPIIILITAALVALSFLAGMRYGGGPGINSSGSGQKKVLYYVDPMNPGHRYDKPGIAPCGMPLEPVYADGSAAQPVSAIPGSVTISQEKQQLIGIKVEAAEKSQAVRTIRLLGKVAADETMVYQLNSSVQGWIREVSPYSTGSLVKKGTILATFYAPEFLAAEQAYVYSLSSSNYRPTFKVGSAQPNLIGQTTQQYEDNLRNLGMGETQIKELARTQEFQENIRIESPVTGFILTRNISPGLRFDKVTEFYRIADLSKVWILLDAYEDEANYFHPGDTVTVIYRGSPIKAKVSNILPPFDPVSRTLKVRLIADNPGYVLRPDMFVDVELQVTMPAAIVVPADAVLDSGLRKTVFVAKGNGVFEPRAVETGSYFDSRVTILKGVMPGEMVVVSGNFLIDSESRMKAPSQGMPGETAVDPSCGMLVVVERAKGDGLTIQRGEKTYFFCSRECRESFERSGDQDRSKLPKTGPAMIEKPARKPHDHSTMEKNGHGNMHMDVVHDKPAAVKMEMPKQNHIDKGPVTTEIPSDMPKMDKHDQMKMDNGGGEMKVPATMDGMHNND